MKEITKKKHLGQRLLDLRAMEEAISCTCELGSGEVCYFSPEVSDALGEMYDRYDEAGILHDMFSRCFVEEWGGEENELYESDVLIAMIGAGVQAFIKELAETVEEAVERMKE